MMLAVMVLPAIFADAATAEPVATGGSNATAYGLASNVQDGNIFHAFNWRFKDVSKFIKDIAEQGFSAVQVSPVQGNKITINSGAYAIDWWAYYQPTNFKVGNQLGTSAEFKAMCDAAHEYGVKIIVDVVANHMAQNETVAAPKSGEKSPQIDPDLLNDTSCWHTSTSNTGDNSRDQMTQNNLAGLPDLNTGSTKVQAQVLGLLKSCVDLGADGFRFDAAKHIELPSESSGVSSAFWTNVIGDIKKQKSNVFIYGEVLSLAGKASISGYTNFMSVTDYTLGGTVRSAVASKTASGLPTGSGSYGSTGAAANKLVTWVESHDNFCDGTSTVMTHTQLLQGYALLAGRKDAPALFLGRPLHEKVGAKGVDYDELMGGPGNLLWQDKKVAELNAFKNAFVGKSEDCKASGSVYTVSRNNEGAIIVNLGNSSVSSASVTMANGTYKDQISGNSYTVSGNTVSGSIPAGAILVLYNKTNTVPVFSLKQDGKEIKSDSLLRFTGASTDIQITLSNATSGTYKISNMKEQSFTGSVSFTAGSSVPVGRSFIVKVTATNGTRTTEKTYKFIKKNASESRVVYFDNTAAQWKAPYCFIKDGITAVAAYPGTKMELVSGNLYKCTVASTVYNPIVKFNEGPVTTGLDGRTIPLTVLDYGTAATPANREKGGFELVGSMIWSAGDWYDYGEYADFVITDSGEPTTIPKSTIPTTTVFVPDSKILLGDANQDSLIQVKDATAIQKYIAKTGALSPKGLKASDTNEDGVLLLKDVTLLQKYLAKMPISSRIGQLVDYVEPTEAPTQPSTEPPDTKAIYFKDGIGWIGTDGAQIFAYNAASGANVVMTKLNDIVWMAYVPNSWTSVDFYRCDPLVGFSTTAMWNSWTAGAYGSNNKYTTTSPTAGTWGLFNAATDVPPTGSMILYFDNSAAKWSDVYFYAFAGKQFIQFEKIGTSDIWFAEVPVSKTTGFLFKDTPGDTAADWHYQTNDINGIPAGMNCCKPTAAGTKQPLSWYNYAG